MIRTDADGSIVKFLKYYAIGILIIFGLMFGGFLFLWVLVQMVTG